MITPVGIRYAIAGFKKMLAKMVVIRLIKREKISRLALNLRENFSLIRTSRNKAIRGPKVKEAILSPISTKPSEIFPEK